MHPIPSMLSLAQIPLRLAQSLKEKFAPLASNSTRQDTTLLHENTDAEPLRKENACKNSSKMALVRRQFFCSGCQIQHPRSAFSPPELAKLPEKRLCKGLEGKLRLCEHISFSFQDLHSLLTKIDDKQCPHSEFLCEAHSSLPLGVYRGPKLQEDSCGLKIEHYIPLFSCTDRSVATNDEVKRALSRRNDKLCPHLRINSRSVRTQLFRNATYLKLWVPKSKMPSKWEWKNSFSPGYDNIATARCEKCSARFWTGRMEECFYLCVSRSVGRVQNPLDDRWYKQLEYAVM